MPTARAEPDTVHPTDRRQWRDWLAANHATATGVWLVTYKASSGKPGLAYDEAVEEALCFGWIDGRRDTLDAERSKQYFAPRRPGSPWSAPNKRRLERLIEQGQMAPAGLAMIEAAKRDGSWTAYDAVEALQVPPDLAAALAADPTARDRFAAFGRSAKKQLLWWVASAKRPETRAKRVAEVVAAAAEDRNPLASPRPKPAKPT
jgi:uncharacterized protein YdeI (YjbR/CyaY-like superfamily)